MTHQDLLPAEALSFEGRTAVITGASSGIGLAAARRFLLAGASVHALARRAHMIRRSCADLQPEMLERLHPARVDVSDASAVSAWAGTIQGQIDVLIAAAGTNVRGRHVSELTPRVWDEVIGTNLNAVYYIVGALLDRLIRSSGDIIVISSSAASWPDHTGAAYQSSKAGLTGLTRGIAHDLHRQGVRVCTVFPGVVNTPILDKRPDPPPLEARQSYLQPNDIAEICVAAVLMPKRVTLSEIVVMPTHVSSIGFTQSATPKPVREGR